MGREHLLFVGPGRMGLGLGQALHDSGVVASLTYCGRRDEPPPHPLFETGAAGYVWGLIPPPDDTTALFLSVPDGAVEEVAHAVAARGEAPPRCAAFHLSGVLPADPLAPLHAQGYPVGTFHPLQSVGAGPGSWRRLRGSSFALSGDRDALAIGHRLASALEGRPLRVPAAKRPLYHAAAVFASNFLVTVLDAAVRVMEEAGLSDEEARAALLPLAYGTLANVEEVGAAEALTGPVARGDAETVELHLRLLDEEERLLYGALAEATLRLAGERLSDEAREELERILEARR